MKKNFIALMALALVTQAQGASIPADWYRLPEDGGVSSPSLLENSVKSSDADQVGDLLERAFKASGSALDQAIPSAPAPGKEPGKPDNWVPWHSEFFMTDLAVSGSGLLGALTLKGTAAVSTFWRRKDAAPQNLEWTDQREPSQGVSISPEMSLRQVQLELEPAIKAALGSGRVKDESKFRSNLLSVARDFQTLTQAMDGIDAGTQWWVSRFRLDVSVDASGKVLPTVTVGGDLRFRFDWHRIQRKVGIPNPLSQRTHVLGQESVSRLKEFLLALSQDLQALSVSQSEHAEFKAQQFRVGLGISVKGDIGIAKGSASVVGQLYFKRDLTKPIIPIVPTNETIALIETQVQPEHIQFAKDHFIPFDEASNQVIYRVNRARFRKGLEKAGKMASVAMDRAVKSESKRWKIYDLKAGFDVSIGGTLGLVGITGLATSEITFHNQKF